MRLRAGDFTRPRQEDGEFALWQPDCGVLPTKRVGFSMNVWFDDNRAVLVINRNRRLVYGASRPFRQELNLVISRPEFFADFRVQTQIKSQQPIL